jgi:hypothetical protein
MIPNRRRKKQKVKRTRRSRNDASKRTISSAEQIRSGSESNAPLGVQTLCSLLAEGKLRIYRILPTPEET